MFYSLVIRSFGVVNYRRSVLVPPPSRVFRLTASRPNYSMRARRGTNDPVSKTKNRSSMWYSLVDKDSFAVSMKRAILETRDVCIYYVGVVPATTRTRTRRGGAMIGDGCDVAGRDVRSLLRAVPVSLEEGEKHAGAK